MTQIKTIRGATGQVHYFNSMEEAVSFCMRRAEFNELWRVVS